MKTYKLITLIILVLFVSCKEENTELPKVEFNFDEISKNKNDGENVYVNDLEKIFTKEEKENLEKYLDNLEKNKKIKILILTIPSKNISEEEWETTSSFATNGIIINFSKSMKKIDIASDTDMTKILTKDIKDSIVTNTIIPNFNKDNYYIGIKKGLLEIISILDKEGNVWGNVSD